MQDLSICIVSYRDDDKVLKAVSSIEKYTPKTLKKTIYISDNSDRAEEESAAFRNALAQYEDVVYLDNQANLGFGGGHNRVLEHVASRYHAIVNPDIILIEDAFTPILTYLDQNPDVGMLIPRLLDVNGHLQAVYRRDLTVTDMFLRMFCKGHFKKRDAYHTMQDQDYTQVFDVPFAQGSFLVIRSDLFRDLRGFDERFFMYMEDADLCKRVRQKARLVYFPGAQVIHEWERGSHKNKKLFLIHVQSMMKYFRKWKRG